MAVARPNGERSSCVLCAGADPSRSTPLDGLLPPGRSRFVAVSENLVAVPTYGCFVPGYLLLVPRVHVLSFGQLSASVLEEAQALVEDLSARLQVVYGLSVLAFEYGLAASGIRRIEHAHWHLLPSAADLAEWLDQRLNSEEIGSLADLPADRSYVAVRTQHGAVRVYDVGRDVEQARQAHRRIRLRRTVAALDSRVDGDAWDWAEHRCAELIAATVTDLQAGPYAGRSVP
jgi:diadenosine tetraphosphate (Ap4A) HIT family hydrolase